MSFTETKTKPTLQPILKHVSRRSWKELSSEGDSVGINDKTLKQGYLGDLLKKSQIEIEELIMRQNALLSNKSFLGKLKDGGQKIKDRKDELVAALKEKSKTQPQVPLPDMTSVEWQWRESSSPTAPVHTNPSELDSDDDEAMNPLELLASHHSDTPMLQQSKPSSRKDEEDPSLVIMRELKDLDLGDEMTSETEENISKTNDVFSDFGSKLLASLEEKSKSKPKKEPFKPFRPKSQQLLINENGANIKFTGKTKKENTDKGNSPHPSFGISSQPKFISVKDIEIKKSKLFSSENSATGALDFRTCLQIQPLSLKESIEIGNKTQKRLKQLELEEAEASLLRLAAKSQTKDSGSLNVSRRMVYRNTEKTLGEDGDSYSSSSDDE